MVKLYTRDVCCYAVAIPYPCELLKSIFAVVYGVNLARKIPKLTQHQGTHQAPADDVKGPD